MNKITVSLAVVLAIFPVQHSINESFFEDSMERRQLILPSENFDQKEMERLFRSILLERKSVTEVLLVEAMDNPQSVSLSASGYTDMTYPMWKTLFSPYEKTIPPFAELLAIGTNAAMRLRDYRGQVSFALLSGQNPYDVPGCGKNLHIAHALIRRAGNPANPAKWSAYLHVNIISSGLFDENTARCALNAVRSETAVARVEVSIRNDPWFIKDSDFPIVSPFLHNDKPPTEGEYENAAEWSCGVVKNEIFCSGHSAGKP